MARDEEAKLLRKKYGGRRLLRMKTNRKIATSVGKSRVELGRFIVADPEICHGKPTFKGTRIMVWQVLEDAAAGRSWDFICNTRWSGKIPVAAVAEAVRLAGEAWQELHGGTGRRLPRRDSELAAA